MIKLTWPIINLILIPPICVYNIILYKHNNIPYSRKIWRGIKFGGLAVYYYNRQIKIRQNFPLAYIRMAIPYRTAKFKSANILSIAILGSTAKFNARQYFRLYGNTCRYSLLSSLPLSLSPLSLSLPSLSLSLPSPSYMTTARSVASSQSSSSSSSTESSSITGMRTWGASVRRCSAALRKNVKICSIVIPATAEQNGQVKITVIILVKLHTVDWDIFADKIFHLLNFQVV